MSFIQPSLNKASFSISQLFIDRIIQRVLWVKLKWKSHEWNIWKSSEVSHRRVCAAVTSFITSILHSKLIRKWTREQQHSTMKKTRLKVYFYPGSRPTWHHWWEKFMSMEKQQHLTDQSVLECWSSCDLISRRAVVMRLLSNTQLNQKVLMMYLFQLLPSLTMERNDVSGITYPFGSFGRNSFILERQIHFYIPPKNFPLTSISSFSSLLGLLLWNIVGS